MSYLARRNTPRSRLCQRERACAAPPQVKNFVRSWAYLGEPRANANKKQEPHMRRAGHTSAFV